MHESGFYPPGAEFDPRAPFNEPLDSQIEVECTIVLTLCNRVTIPTMRSEAYGIGGEINKEYIVNNYLKDCTELKALKSKGWEYTVEEVM